MFSNKIINKLEIDLSVLSQKSLDNLNFFLDKTNNAIDIQQENIIYLKSIIIHQDNLIKQLLIEIKLLNKKLDEKN